MKTIDLNADIGEGQSYDFELMKVISSANVCCGVHAGSKELSRDTVNQCVAFGVVFGAHPGTSDRESFGRADVEINDELAHSIQEQVEFMVSLGADFIKLHGALYNLSAESEQFASFISSVLRDFGLPFVGMPNTFHQQVAEQIGVQLISEGFVDRTYTDQGILVPRRQPNAILSDLESVQIQALNLATSHQTLCVHGDTANCVLIAESIRSKLEQSGYEIRPWL